MHPDETISRASPGGLTMPGVIIVRRSSSPHSRPSVFDLVTGGNLSFTVDQNWIGECRCFLHIALQMTKNYNTYSSIL
jgi:hypothetical protein